MSVSNLYKRWTGVRPPVCLPAASGKSEDANALAVASFVEIDGDPAPIPSAGNKNAAAVAFGRLGGLKGGAARAIVLSPERRKAIAQKGAAARWKVK